MTAIRRRLFRASFARSRRISERLHSGSILVASSNCPSSHGSDSAADRDRDVGECGAAALTFNLQLPAAMEPWTMTGAARLLRLLPTDKEPQRHATALASYFCGSAFRSRYRFSARSPDSRISFSTSNAFI